jgi:hypothetical protein
MNRPAPRPRLPAHDWETQMKALMAAALLMATSAAPAMTVETANGDWSEIPLLKTRGYALNDHVVGKIYDLVQSGACTIAGQSKKKLDMSIPFLVHFTKDGTPDRLVLGKIGCAEAEGVIGGALVVLIEQGNYRSTGRNQTGWYRSQVSFSYT